MNGFTLTLDWEAGEITSLSIHEKERLAEPSTLFTLSVRDREGVPTRYTSRDFTFERTTECGAIYRGGSPEMTVAVEVREVEGEASFQIRVTPSDDTRFVEWVEFPSLILPPLRENNTEGTGGEILFPYNEGALVSDINKREDCFLRYCEAAYPSRGVNAVFPNMVFAQMLAYVFDDAGLYIGLHDSRRGVKDINFHKTPRGVRLRFRIFCGVDFGEAFQNDYPIILSVTEGRWEACAERYRQWFEKNLPENVKKGSRNSELPAWYNDCPLVVTYPVRGVHDTDIMNPNRMFPLVNGLPKLEKIKELTDARLLVLLMHWEGTAPWAPPYVWPPYGGVDGFRTFLDQLHAGGDMLGVYCSGFGYTLQSNLIAEYNKKEEFDRHGLIGGMCADVDGIVKISDICTAQRSGYDICPASEIGASVLNEAYRDLLLSGIDYAQILDQNHGGGQYFCYSREHGHPPAPGPWMTENMQSFLSGWNRLAPKMLFGCESSAAEPFLGNLGFSDNRFELNYRIGVPVPLFAYLYHEYLRNFMGNQVCCPFSETDDDSLLYRMAYSFSIGDSMTLILDQDGNARSWWGKLYTEHIPSQEKLLRLVKNLTAFYREQGKPYLSSGRMIQADRVECDTVSFGCDNGTVSTLPALLCSAWEASDGTRARILVNPKDEVARCRLGEGEITVAPLSAILLPV